MINTISRQISSLLTRHGIAFHQVVQLTECGLHSKTFRGGFLGEGNKVIAIEGTYRHTEKCGLDSYVVVSLKVNGEVLNIGKR